MDEGWVTYAVGYCAGHGGDHGNAAATAPADHLFGYCLRRHEDARNINLNEKSAIDRAARPRPSLCLTSNIILASLAVYSNAVVSC